MNEPWESFTWFNIYVIGDTKGEVEEVKKKYLKK